ncbi:DUF1801 domain-containing protein [Demequina sp. NBRC 110052]|uniref:DUF1801 domain-containing protein n=1 Tax=Demequina sp. NBRC 110052 TaxID=1570341 RepID=UPI0009FC39E9|nr:DUF1801 domain-containing protein [Demequina sp. NBRC 110052]
MGDSGSGAKTRPTDVPVEEFVARVTPERRRLEAQRVVALLTEATGEDPVMWGPSIIGWGTYHYEYASGRSGDWMKVGFSPRKAQLTFYGLKDSEAQETALTRLGAHTTGVGCVYVKRLDDIDVQVLRELAVAGMARGDHDATA